MTQEQKQINKRNDNKLNDNNDTMKVGGNLQAAAWLSETKVITSRGGYVFIWIIDNTFSNCIGYVPRNNTSPVTEIHILNGDTVIFVVANGRSIEV